MESPNVELFITGATGFIGREAVREALGRGYRVKALARSAARATDLAQWGATIVEGDAASPEAWIAHAARATALIDLVQPNLPNRITLEAIRAVAGERLAITKRLCSALGTIPAADRPILLSVSGLDDLAPDDGGRVTDDSPLRTDLSGFAHIGIPVRRAIEASGLRATFAYLGTVYGPGKTFASKIFPEIAAGKFRMAGSGMNRTPQIHVEDAARALVHLAALESAQIEGRTFILADGANTTMADFLGLAARLLGAKPPGKAPLWLANIVAGKVLVETATRDVVAEPRALLKSGFTFRYPSFHDGLPPTIEKLGYTKQPSRTSLLDRTSFFRMVSILAVSLFVAANVALNLPQIRRMTAGLHFLDMRFAYSATSAHRFLDVLGSRGRSLYLTELWTFDLVAPIIFATFLSAAIRRTPLRRFRNLPFFGAAFDYAENIAITILLVAYPAAVPSVVVLAAIFTAMKWILDVSSVVAALAGLVPLRATSG